jgi:hypothetical protein
MPHGVARGPHSARPGSAKFYRGSHKRLGRIRRDLTPDIWILIIAVALILFVVLSWLIHHPVTATTHWLQTTTRET